MTAAKTYFDVIDKTAWGDGPWKVEPDKKQWADPVTGLPCLIVRGPHGALCGYVGVSEAHPFFGKGYDDVPVGDDSEHSPHGGLTYAAKCQPSKDERKGVCHVPASGEPDHVWWFGFDCAHCDDLCPKHTFNIARTFLEGDSDYEVYRDLAYVTAECTRLAAHLQTLTKAEG